VIDNILDDCKEMGVQTIILSGGEPLLHPKLYEILILAKIKYGFKTSVITSGAFTPNNFRKCFMLIDRLNISLDTLDPKIYLKLRRYPINDVLSFTKLVSSLKINQQINVWATTTKYNKNVNALEAWSELLGITFHSFPVKTDKKLMTSNKRKMPKENCAYNYLFAIVDASGIVMTCCKLMHDNSDFKTINKKLILGNVNNDNFYHIWNSKKARTIREKIYQHKFRECIDCDRGLEINKGFTNYLREKKSVFL
jgi:MoaA/NifB/PqqE/SkfB family radical SAM enzyme